MIKCFDSFLTSLIITVLFASFFPCPPAFQPCLAQLTSLLITLMFFFQGAKLQRSAMIKSLHDWRLQGSILLVTFGLFPLLGAGLVTGCRIFFPSLSLPAELWEGILFLCCLPSTVQSSIALTSIARGNIAASICAATVSNILGIFFTPLLSSFILRRHGEISGTETILDVVHELLFPFLLGQVTQKWVGPLVQRYKLLLSFTDRGSILVMIYTTFSMTVIQGLWRHVPLSALFLIAVINALLLFCTLCLTWLLSRILGQKTEKMIALQFCGSKKSLATGIPIASVIFPARTGMIVLPLMMYHQLQLFTCTFLAQHYARRR